MKMYYHDENWGGARKGAGRPKKERKTETLSVRITAGFKPVIEFRARAKGYSSISQYVAALINEDALGMK